MKKIEAFLVRHKMKPTTFGKEAMKDPTLVFGLRRGRDVRVSTENSIREFMSSYSARPARRKDTVQA